jgi:hypothetical protein
MAESWQVSGKKVSIVMLIVICIENIKEDFYWLRQARYSQNYPGKF